MLSNDVCRGKRRFYRGVDTLCRCRGCRDMCHFVFEATQPSFRLSVAVLRGNTLAQYDLGIRGNSKPARLFESSPLCYPELQKLLTMQNLRIFGSVANYGQACQYIASIEVGSTKYLPRLAQILSIKSSPLYLRFQTEYTYYLGHVCYIINSTHYNGHTYCL